MPESQCHGRATGQVEAGSTREWPNGMKHLLLHIGEYRLVLDHDALLAPQELSRARATQPSTSSSGSFSTTCQNLSWRASRP